MMMKNQYARAAKMYNIKILIINRGDIPEMIDFYDADLVLEQQSNENIFKVIKNKNTFPKLNTNINISKELINV